MKSLFATAALIVGMVGCGTNEQAVSEFTGNETTYALQQSSRYVVSGIVTFKEKKDGSTLVEVELKGTSGNAKYPVHLHLGNLSVQGASVAAQLSPVLGSTGKSQTSLTQLADETKISYQAITKLDASIKIHLSDSGLEKDIILSAGNIGIASANGLSSGRLGVAVCESK